MFKWKGSRHNEAVRTIFESYYGQYWVECPAAAGQDPQTDHVPAEVKYYFFLLFFVFFLLYLYWLIDGKLPGTKSKTALAGVGQVLVWLCS